MNTLQSMLSNILKIPEELYLLGLKGGLYRVWYEISVRSGLKSFLSSLTGLISKKSQGTVSLDFWKKKRTPFFTEQLNRPDIKSIYRETLSDELKKEILQEAELISKGKVRCFSHTVRDYGNPVNWHFNPDRKASWPSGLHWSKAASCENRCGDIKLTWEINRFPHLYTLVRAYYITEDDKWVTLFSEQLKSWEEANHYGFGVNWSSCQEVAIRSLVWIFALNAFKDSQAFSEEDFRRIQRLLYLHAEHIDRNINFARYCLHNNHLIGEALALYAIGNLFPWFTKAKKWKKKGRKLLVKDCLEQFHRDGGYCQSSHNYHRLALHYYIWALRIGESAEEKFPESIYETLGKSAEYLASFLNEEDGRLPNWGANDGALLNPWTSCSFSDFRPLLTSIRYLTRNEKAFPHGLWDEELFWFFGPESLRAPVAPYQSESASFINSGVHVLRKGEKDFIAFRCGPVTDRSGHADQLDIDLWWKGLNIAIDGGAYLYNDHIQYHKYFMGTHSHNTVFIDEEDQMNLHRRFTWLNRTKARLLKFDQAGNSIIGEHYGYKRVKGKVIHKRSVTTLENGSYLIQDRLIQQNPEEHTYTLHWHINDFNYRIVKEESSNIIIEFNTQKGNYYLAINAGKDAEFKLLRADDDSQSPNGWHSQYYGEKLPALSINISYQSKNGAAFTSIFSENMELINGAPEQWSEGENRHSDTPLLPHSVSPAA